MSEPAFREIQLTKKQLVFLFMASVVLAAVVFLLGVSLGRRLPSAAQGAGATTPASAAVAPTEMPPPTVLTPDDQRFAVELQGKGSVPPAVPVPPQASTTSAPVQPAATPATTPVAAPATPTPKQVETPTPRPAAAAPAATTARPPAAAPPAAPAAAKPAPPAGSWFVQVNAFRSRENAEAEVRKLKGQGHAAFVVPGGTLFRVRVGPFGDRAGADTAAAKLRQAGFKPSITR